jgi:hypothetical protein
MVTESPFHEFPAELYISPNLNDPRRVKIKVINCEFSTQLVTLFKAPSHMPYYSSTIRSSSLSSKAGNISDSIIFYTSFQNTIRTDVVK